MKIKTIFLIFLLILITGCTNVNDLTIDTIVSNLKVNDKKVNTYRQGYSFYKPSNLQLEDAGANYLIFSSSTVNYYVYLDFVSLSDSKEIPYEINPNAYYSQKINNNGFYGYLEINLWKNNQYLIEIMYNYAKIEVMVDKDELNSALINSINILKSIRYNDAIIESLLKDDSLDRTEEVFDIFSNVNNNNSNVLEPTTDVAPTEEENSKDTDYLN